MRRRPRPCCSAAWLRACCCAFSAAALFLQLLAAPRAASSRARVPRWHATMPAQLSHVFGIRDVPRALRHSGQIIVGPPARPAASFRAAPGRVVARWVDWPCAGGGPTRGKARALLQRGIRPILPTGQQHARRHVAPCSAARGSSARRASAGAPQRGAAAAAARARLGCCLPAAGCGPTSSLACEEHLRARTSRFAASAGCRALPLALRKRCAQLAHKALASCVPAD